MTASPARKALVIAGTGLRRMSRDPTNIFFLFVFPMVMVLILGLVFGGGFEVSVGVVAPDGDPLADEVVESLRDHDEVTLHAYDSEADLRDAVELGHVQGGVVVPADYGARLRAGDDVEVGFLMGSSGLGALLQPIAQEAVGDQSSRVQAARFAAEHGAGDFDAALADVTDLSATLTPIPVRTEEAGDTSDEFEGLGRFDLGASGQLLLFMFVSGLASSAGLIQSRQLGVSRRMLATPTSLGTVLAGETLGRLATVLVQGAYIMTATWLLFDVNWGDPVGAVLLLVAFGLVATGVAMLAGSVFKNDQQAGSVGVFLGLGLAALGGCMVPLEVFSPTMRKVAHVTPHAWANDAFAELVRRDGGLVDILPDLAVLAAMAAAVLALATWRLRKSLTSG